MFRLAALVAECESQGFTQHRSHIKRGLVAARPLRIVLARDLHARPYGVLPNAWFTVLYPAAKPCSPPVASICAWVNSPFLSRSA